MMRSKLADVSPDQLPEASIDKLSVDHTGTGIHGSRVVVEGSLSHMQTASEVAAASAPNGASGASAVVATAKPVKPQKVVKAAAVECTFTGLNLASFRWLAPAELVKTNEDAASDSAE
jgi:hypothetical protein